MHLPFESVALDWDETLELFARRNVLVHNEGRVNRQYLARVSKTEKELAIGTELPVGEHYVNAALDNLLVLGLLLGVMTWAKTHRETQHEAASFLSGKTYDLMLADRWVVVKRLCEVGGKIDCAERARLVFKFNEWQARKRISGLAAVQDELRAFDTSAVQEDFELARLSLLEECSQGLDLLETLLDQGRLPVTYAREWPIFAELRSHPRFEEIIRRASVAKSAPPPPPPPPPRHA